MGTRAVRIAPNFDRNLEEIRRFLGEQQAPHAFIALLDDLFGTVIPNLERFPELGRDFLERSPGSVEGEARREKLFRLVARKWHLREYITGDYLILYAVGDNAIGLLAIKHHRQLSFDLKAHWL
ncbi:MAG: type II toxin-antitoxin system RelE/ParE family toxin [Woeseiaceae bacterium]